MPSGGPRTDRLERDAQHLRQKREQEIEQLVADLVRSHGRSVANFARLWAECILLSPTTSKNFSRMVVRLRDILKWIDYEERRRANRKDIQDELSFIGGHRKQLLHDLKVAAYACPAVFARVEHLRRKRKKLFGFL